MFNLTRVAAAVYVLSIFVGGYLAVSTLKGLWSEADRFEALADASAHGADTLNNTLLVFDAIEPAAGQSN